MSIDYYCEGLVGEELWDGGRSRGVGRGGRGGGGGMMRSWHH